MQSFSYLYFSKTLSPYNPYTYNLQGKRPCAVSIPTDFFFSVNYQDLLLDIEQLILHIINQAQNTFHVLTNNIMNLGGAWGVNY